MKIENLMEANYSCYKNDDIDRLTINKFGRFNLFSGTTENGYKYIHDCIQEYYPIHKSYGCVHFFDNFCGDAHFSTIKGRIDVEFRILKENINRQIFATTQRYDVIQAFAEVAKEYGDVAAYYYRLGRSGHKDENGRSIVTMYDIDALLDATNQKIEVR